MNFSANDLVNIYFLPSATFITEMYQRERKVNLLLFAEQARSKQREESIQVVLKSAIIFVIFFTNCCILMQHALLAFFHKVKQRSTRAVVLHLPAGSWLGSSLTTETGTEKPSRHKTFSLLLQCQGSILSMQNPHFSLHS